MELKKLYKEEMFSSCSTERLLAKSIIHLVFDGLHKSDYIVIAAR